MNSHTWNKVGILGLSILLSLLIVSGCSLFSPYYEPNPYDYHISNPYAGINWETAELYDGNFHTHTKLSDGRIEPHNVIDLYKGAGYSVLALTDHYSSHAFAKSEALHPWTAINAYYEEIKDIVRNNDGDTWASSSTEAWQDRDPLALAMVSVGGSEISANYAGAHHIGSLFSDTAGMSHPDEETIFNAIGAQDGLAIFNHPGRYSKEISWYTDFYIQFDCLVGLEVFNQNDRYPNDRKLWDRLLHQVMPDTPIWGFANDDMHSLSNFGWNRNVLVLEQLDDTSLRASMEQGQFYMFRAYVQAEPADFSIDRISTSENAIHIEVTGGEHTVRWITFDPNLNKSVAIHSGNDFNTVKLPMQSVFVRAEIYGPNGRIYTQPFGFERIVSD
jgi:hypothetical protein